MRPHTFRTAFEGQFVHPTTGSCTHFEIAGDRQLKFCRGLVWVARYPRPGADDQYATWCDTCNEVRYFHDNEPDPCPGCARDLWGQPIPQRDWHSFGTRRFSNRIDVYDQDLDRVTSSKCPYCKHEWGKR